MSEKAKVVAVNQTTKTVFRLVLLVLTLAHGASAALAQQIDSPIPNSTLSGDSVDFDWSDGGAGVTEWWLNAGSTPGGSDYFDSKNLGLETTVLVTGLPVDGSTVHTRLWYRIGASAWAYIDETYIAATISLPMITVPIPDTDLSGSSEVFEWSDVGAIGVTDWWIVAGASVGGSNYFNSNNLGTATTVTVTGLPVDGSTVNVRLWYRIGSTPWAFIDEEYTASTEVLPAITSPAPLSTLTSASETFTWSDSGGLGVTEWWLHIGSTAGGTDYFNSGNLGALESVVVNSLPIDGSTVHARLWYRVGPTPWQTVDTTYTAGSLVTPGFVTPISLQELTGDNASFEWEDSGNIGFNQWWLYVGSSVGANDYYNSGNLLAATTTLATGLPIDGTTVYARLWYRIDSGGWQTLDAVYIANGKRLANPTGKLNDTGTRDGGDYPSGNFADCANGSSISNQDCYLGRDAEASIGALVKIGFGSHGFDFTKIDEYGGVLPEASASWSCVLDNQTGNMWEVKTAGATDLHGGGDTFTWYDTNPNSNGGGMGEEGASNNTCFGYSAGESLTYCNTEAFVNRVNAEGLCGYSNWRMPNFLELMSIVDHSALLPAIDTGLFPNTPSTTTSYFWTSSPVVANNTQAWNIRTMNGYGSNRPNTTANGVRLIRSE